MDQVSTTMEQRIQVLEASIAQMHDVVTNAQAAQTNAEAAAAIAQQQAALARTAPEPTEASRMRDARRALNWVPKFEHKTPWNQFESEFNIWYSVNQIERVGNEFGKLSLMAAMRGQAAQSVKPYAQNTATWNGNPTYAAYFARIREVFLPPQESELARVEFRSRKQGRNEDISSYLSSKIALWQMAFSDTERSFSTLFTETIRGCYSAVVKRELHRKSPTNEQTLRSTLLHIVATERESYKQGYGEATSLDGLAAVSQMAKEYGGDDEQMDWESSMNAMRSFEGTCFKCRKKGHRASECRQGARNDKAGKGNADRNREKTCYFCKKVGHLASECYKKKAQEGAGAGKRGDGRGQQKDPRPFARRGGKIRKVEEEETEIETEEQNHFLDLTGGQEEN